MISFENIDKPNIKYTLLYKYVNLVHNYIFYKKYIVLHNERIPKNKPVVAICNHQNGLSDALGILFAFKKDGRYPVFIARADIFKREIAAKLLRFLRIMPAFRVRDTGKKNLGENEAIFNKSADILLKNGVVCLFPEAGHQDCHHLGTFKKGFARIAFQAAERSGFKEQIMIQPMSNHYSNYFRVQGKLMITIGEPFDFMDLYELYQTQPKRAEKILADRARVKVKELMLDIEDLSLYEEYDTIRSMYDKEYLKREEKATASFPNQLEADKKIVESLDRLRAEDPQQFDSLMKKGHAYMRNLEKLHLRDWIFQKELSVWGFFFRLVIAILLLPLIAVSFLINLIPYNVSSTVTRRIKDPMLHSSFHFVIGALFTYPLWFVILCAIVWPVTGLWWTVPITLATLPLSLMVYLWGKVLWKKLYNRIRRFRFWYHGNATFNSSVELRKELVKELDDIVR